MAGTEAANAAAEAGDRDPTVVKARKRTLTRTYSELSISPSEKIVVNEEPKDGSVVEAIPPLMLSELVAADSDDSATVVKDYEGWYKDK